ncbi:MAG TPA: hypothetical protein VNK49_12400 [Anaerolineales bacterium]|nr:hypothetical protein [Anaerolineales bacterium]
MNASSFHRNLHVSEKGIPFVFLFVLILAFGLRIFSLGIYQDDWVFVYNAYVRGAKGLWAFLNADGTPLSSAVNIALFSLLGVKPLYWHLASLIARWLTVVAFWLVLRHLWPSHARLTFFTALVFAIHPFFTLQPLAFTFLHVWLGYCSLGFSFYWMLLSVEKPERFWFYFTFSILAGILTIITLEYFAGLEFARPLLLWMALRNSPKDLKTKLLRVATLSAPYFLVLGIYLIWRFFIFVVPIAQRNNPVGVQMLLQNPVEGFQLIFSNLIPDLLTIVVSAWYGILAPRFFDLTDRRNVLFALLSLFAGLVLYILFHYQRIEQHHEERNPVRWHREAFWLGLCLAVLGLIPPYVGGLYINEKNPLWSSRFGLASLVGASLIFIALWEYLFSKGKARYIFLAALLGLSVGYHARYIHEFRGSWRKQLNFYRQLILRAPHLEAGSAIIAPEEILYYMGDYPTAYAINTIYAKPDKDKKVSNEVEYWFFGITTHFSRQLDEFATGMLLEATHRNIRFTGNSNKSLIITFEPEKGECLHVIRPQDASFRKLPPFLKQTAHLSSLDLIKTDTPAYSPFLEEIGVKYPDDWCTYYTRADLARQSENWTEVLALWREARKRGFTPGTYFEYFPFLDAMIHLHQWNGAIHLTLEMKRVFPASRPTLCDYWLALPDSPAYQLALTKLEPKLHCLEP